MRKSQTVLLLFSIIFYSIGIASNILFHHYIPNYNGKVGYARETMIELAVLIPGLLFLVVYLRRRNPEIDTIWISTGKAYVGLFWITLITIGLIISVLPP